MRSPKRSPSPTAVDWPAHVEALSRSGLTALAYARAHGLKPDTLYRWRRRLRSPAEPPRLVPLTIEATAPCEVVLPDGRILRFPVTLPAQTLGAWLAAMGAR
jgi:hypothetical protein